jgi:hypothetical protein
MYCVRRPSEARRRLDLGRGRLYYFGTIFQITADISGKLIPDSEVEKHARARVAMARQ